MLDDEIDKLFSLCGTWSISEDEKNDTEQKLKNYFIRNYKKHPEILSIYFERMGYKKLINIGNNLETLQNILNNAVFFSYFRNSELYISDLFKILTAYNQASEYNVDQLKIEEKFRQKNIKKIKEIYEEFISLSKKIYNFELWFNHHTLDAMHEIFEKIPTQETEEDELLEIDIGNKINSMVNFSEVFAAYYQDIQCRHKNKRNFNPKEKNTEMNYFIRELINIFNDLESKKIPPKIIIELVWVTFETQIDNTQLKNILNGANAHSSNTSYTVQYTIKEVKDDKEAKEFEIEYIKTKNAYGNF